MNPFEALTAAILVVATLFALIGSLIWTFVSVFNGNGGEAIGYFFVFCVLVVWIFVSGASAEDINS